jgi:hypothetical protein
VLRTGTPRVLCLVSYATLLAAATSHTLIRDLARNHNKSCPGAKEQHANCLMLHLRESAAEGTSEVGVAAARAGWFTVLRKADAET